MPDEKDERRAWLTRLDRVAGPVLKHLAAGTLRAAMPVEHHAASHDRADCTHLEAFGRTAAGIAPWLALKASDIADADERGLHRAYRDRFARATAAAVSPASPDRMNFERGQQAIVDTAFLAHAVVRAPAVFRAMPTTVVDALAAAFRRTRDRKPAANNWLLFAAMTECGLRVLSGDCDPMRVDYAVRQHEQWYLGGGLYGDGPHYHADYYNSFVVQPMLIDVLRTAASADAVHGRPPLDAAYADLLPPVLARARRYAEVLERSVAPDGSYPPVGRSITYRCGAFQHLARLALQHELPATLPPAQVRGVLGRVIRRTLDAPGTFDPAGWLTIGLGGHQPTLGEPYLSTGSLYLAATALLPLGLPPADPFWSGPAARSTWERVWRGESLPADHD